RIPKHEVTSPYLNGTGADQPRTAVVVGAFCGAFCGEDAAVGLPFGTHSRWPTCKMLGFAMRLCESR
ncbi:MAG TPA: hypothetical protein V6C65_20385, partial [Allocoleopsis sp.]